MVKDRNPDNRESERKGANENVALVPRISRNEEVDRREAERNVCFVPLRVKDRRVWFIIFLILSKTIIFILKNKKVL